MEEREREKEVLKSLGNIREECPLNTPPNPTII
jgi:hypothetical protein